MGWATDRTEGVPRRVVMTARCEVGPRMDAMNIKHEDRAVILWDEKDGKRPTCEEGYLFIAPEAARNERFDPLIVTVRGRRRPYVVKAAGYVGDPFGYVPPGYPRTYRATRFPNRLLAFIIRPMVFE